MVESPRISAVILSGGRAQRMGGVDKGLTPLGGRPLIVWVLERIAPQVDELFISANRNLESYRPLGYPVLADVPPDFQGPLAGLRRCMTEATNPLILCAPCDTPFLPPDLAGRLLGAIEASGADIALPVVSGQTQHAIFLCRRTVLPGLENFINHGGRRVGEWQSKLRCIELPFGDEHAFLNLNTAEELAAGERELNT